MLEAQRVDIAFYWYPVLKEVDNIHRNKALSLYQDKSRLVCHPTTDNEIFIQKFNEHLQKLKNNGWLKKEKNKYFQ